MYLEVTILMNGREVGSSPTHRFILQRYYAIRFATLFKRFFVVGIATAGAVVFLKDKADDDSKEPPSDG